MFFTPIEYYVSSENLIKNLYVFAFSTQSIINFIRSNGGLLYIVISQSHKLHIESMYMLSFSFSKSYMLYMLTPRNAKQMSISGRLRADAEFFHVY